MAVALIIKFFYDNLSNAIDIYGYMYDTILHLSTTLQFNCHANLTLPGKP
mgnify:CR=1 FL=1